MSLGKAAIAVNVAPEKVPWSDGEHFGGKIATFTVADSVMSVETMQARKQATLIRT